MSSFLTSLDLFSKPVCQRAGVWAPDGGPHLAGELELRKQREWVLGAAPRLFPSRVLQAPSATPSLCALPSSAPELWKMAVLAPFEDNVSDKLFFLGYHCGVECCIRVLFCFFFPPSCHLRKVFNVKNNLLTWEISRW